MNVTAVSSPPAQAGVVRNEEARVRNVVSRRPCRYRRRSPLAVGGDALGEQPRRVRSTGDGDGERDHNQHDDKGGQGQPQTREPAIRENAQVAAPFGNERPGVISTSRIWRVPLADGEHARATAWPRDVREAEKQRERGYVGVDSLPCSKRVSSSLRACISAASARRPVVVISTQVRGRRPW